MWLFITYVSYTDIEIKLEPSDEEFTDCEGKLKIHIKYTKYISVLFIASSTLSIRLGQKISYFSVSSFFYCLHASSIFSSFSPHGQQLTSSINILLLQISFLSTNNKTLLYLDQLLSRGFVST